MGFKRRMFLLITAQVDKGKKEVSIRFFFKLQRKGKMYRQIGY